MDSAHDRFETLAVGHVLGGLEASDAQDFRSHLHHCGACRQRVVELRGIADDLAAAERDERSRARVRTTQRPRTAQDDEAPTIPTVSVRAFGILVLATLVVLGALGFWNLHLRTQVATAVGGGERLEETLRTIADGAPLDADLEPPVRGHLASDDARVAFALTGLPVPEDDQVVIVWRMGTVDGDEPVLLTRPDDGRVSGSVEIGDATAVLVTLQRVTVGDEPTPGGTHLVRAELP